MVANRLPTGQYRTDGLPVMHVGSVPLFDPETWDLRVYGLVEVPRTVTYAEFRALPRTLMPSDFHCVTTWSAYDIQWEGIPFAALVRPSRPLPEAKYVLLHGDGGYSANLPVDALMDDDVLIADRRDGEPLPTERGFPARLVVPKRYAYKSVKWLRGIEFVSEDRPGFWETRGYSNSGDPLTEDRFS